MDLRKILVCIALVFALIVSTGNARSLEKRSPQEGEEAADPCADGAWLNFESFGIWCETGVAGQKAEVTEE